MRLLIIPQTYPDNTNPNLTTFIKEHTENLSKKIKNIIVLHTKIVSIKKKNIFYRGIKLHSEKNITRYSNCCVFLPFFKRINTLVFYYKNLKLFKKITQKYGKPDIIISHFYQYAGWSAIKIGKKYGIPVVSIEHAGWLLNKKIQKYEKNKLKFVAKNSAQIISVSEQLKESIIYHTKLSKLNICVIPNMVADIYTYHKRIKKKNFVFFSAGNLFINKRFYFLISAFCKSFSKTENVKLYIAGEGPEKERLKKLIADNKRNQQIILLGNLNKAKMLKYYEYCDCFVLPSEHESFGIVYREALAVGRPIITTNHQGFYNCWHDCFGIKIQTDNYNELVLALKNVYNNIDKYNLKLISTMCRNTYSSNKILNSYLFTLTKLLIR